MIKERIQSADLRALQVLQDFSAAQLNQLSRNMTVLNVRKGEAIYRPGQLAENLYLVLDGAIGLSILGSKGSSLRLAVLAQGEFFGNRRAYSRLVSGKPRQRGARFSSR